MTREQYHAEKQSLHNMTRNIRTLRPVYRQEQRHGNLSKANKCLRELLHIRRECRAVHIFMSLLRGKIREQIERVTRTIPDEQRIVNLCQQYAVDYDTYLVSDAKGTYIKVISVQWGTPLPQPDTISDVVAALKPAPEEKKA